MFTTKRILTVGALLLLAACNDPIGPGEDLGTAQAQEEEENRSGSEDNQGRSGGEDLEK